MAPHEMAPHGRDWTAQSAACRELKRRFAKGVNIWRYLRIRVGEMSGLKIAFPNIPSIHLSHTFLLPVLLGQLLKPIHLEADLVQS